MLGLLRADAGQARLFGGDRWADAVELHRRLAYVPGDVNLWPNLSAVRRDLLGALRGGLDPGRRAELIERFELDPTKKGRAYSRGNRQKVALIAAPAADAELLVLDEPTAGLDPLQEATFRQYIEQARDAGRTVLLSSHILAKVEALCDRVTIIRAGKTVETGSLAELRHLTRTSIRAETPARALRDPARSAGLTDRPIPLQPRARGTGRRADTWTANRAGDDRRRPPHPRCRRTAPAGHRLTASPRERGGREAAAGSVGVPAASALRSGPARARSRPGTARAGRMAG